MWVVVEEVAVAVEVAVAARHLRELRRVELGQQPMQAPQHRLEVGAPRDLRGPRLRVRARLHLRVEPLERQAEAGRLERALAHQRDQHPLVGTLCNFGA